MLALIPLSDLTTPATVDEARQSIYSVIGLTGVNTTDWRPGAVIRTVITGVAVIYAALTSLIALIAAGGFLATAKGTWKKLVALHVFGVTALEATFAVGTVTIVNSAGGVFDYNPFELTFTNNATGKTYRNTAAVHIGSNATVTGIPIQADEIGSDSNAAPGDITLMKPQVSNLSVNNPASVLGQDDESDADLEQRCSDKLGSFSPNGPSDAYAFAARSVLRSDGTPIGVNRVRVTPNGAGRLDVFCATATGGITGVVGDLTTDLGRIDDAIQRQAAPLGIDVRTHSALAAVVPIAYNLYLYNTAGLTAALVQSYVDASLAKLFARQPVGGNRVEPSDTIGYVYHSAISAAISDAVTAEGVALPTFRLDLLQPAGDVALTASSVPILGSSSPSIIMVPRAGL